MAITIRATFDGKAFVPKEQVDLPKDTDVTLTVDTTEELSAESRYLFFKAARAANLKGPPDWSSRLDEYLYHGRGFPKLDDE
jgi:hypothetical protein